ncbi:MAG: helix-turn-helix transcriptional regulator [Salinigranum sp.]
MNRRQADAAVGSLVVAVLVIGGVLSWQAVKRQQAFDRMGSMMGTSMGAVHGTNPLWYVLGTLLVAAAAVVVYLAVRDSLPESDAGVRSSRGQASVADRDPADSPGDGSGSTASVDQAARPRARVLDILPEDERRVLEPVVTSPGITQIELRDRSNFSKSKVSQTVSELEKRGLLYRERQGRTYRIYPSDELRQRQP